MIQKRPRDWTVAEAGEFFKWLLEIKSSRISQIIAISDAASTAAGDEAFRRITDTLHRSLGNLTDVGSGKQIVNGLGVVAGFDAALVIGETLAATVPRASWQIMRTPIKDLISRNLPVVRCSEDGPGFEPFMEGRLLLSLIGRETGPEPSNVLDTVYQKWSRGLCGKLTW
jgi:hypothetical protein